MSQAIVPAGRNLAATTERQEIVADFKLLMAQAADNGLIHLALPGATVINTRQSVPISWLWKNPLLESKDLNPRAEHVQRLASTIALFRDKVFKNYTAPFGADTRGQIDRVIVTSFIDGRKKRLSPVDQSKTLMIVRGVDVYQAMIDAGETYVDIEVQYYPSFYAATIASLASALTSGPNANYLQKGILICAIKDAHRLENAQREEAGAPLLPELPIDEELAKDLDLNPTEFSVCQRLPEQPEEFLMYIRTENLLFSEIVDLVAIPDVVERVRLAQEFALARIRGTPLSRDDTRKKTRRAKKGAESTPIILPAVVIEDVGRLLYRPYTEMAIPAAAHLLHDTQIVMNTITAAMSDKSIPKPIKALVQALNADEIIDWITDTLQQNTETTDTEEPDAGIDDLVEEIDEEIIE